MVQESITANIFNLPSSKATTAYQTAQYLYQWSILSMKESIRNSWDFLISSRQEYDLGDLSADSKELIHCLILEEYLKIRCFGHTAKIMELYKDTKVFRKPDPSDEKLALKTIEPLNLSECNIQIAYHSIYHESPLPHYYA